MAEGAFLWLVHEGRHTQIPVGKTRELSNDSMRRGCRRHMGGVKAGLWLGEKERCEGVGKHTEGWAQSEHPGTTRQKEGPAGGYSRVHSDSSVLGCVGVLIFHKSMELKPTQITLSIINHARASITIMQTHPEPALFRP